MGAANASGTYEDSFASSALALVEVGVTWTMRPEVRDDVEKKEPHGDTSVVSAAASASRTTRPVRLIPTHSGSGTLRSRSARRVSSVIVQWIPG